MVLYVLIALICLLYILMKKDNFLKWLFLYTTQYCDLVALFITLDFEIPINLRVFLLCFYGHMVKWLGSLRYKSLKSNNLNLQDVSDFRDNFQRGTGALHFF